MSDLINKLKKAMELKLPKRQSFDKGCLVDVGAAAENARLRPLLDALIECAEHAETMHRGFEQDIATVPRSIVAGHLKHALARLNKLVSEGDVP